MLDLTPEPGADGGAEPPLSPSEREPAIYEPPSDGLRRLDHRKRKLNRSGE